VDAVSIRHQPIANFVPIEDLEGVQGRCCLRIRRWTRIHARGQDIKHFGPSTYASEMVLPDNSVVKIRDDMPLEKAALIGCAVTTGVGSVINTARVPTGASLAIFGTGGIGLNAIQGGRLCGAFPLIAVDVADNKLEFARVMGATHTVNGARESVVDSIKELTYDRGAEYAIVAVGSTQAMQQAWDATAPGGTCVVIGPPASSERISIDPMALYRDEKRLTGSRYGSARVLDDFGRLIDLYLGGELQLDELITIRYGLTRSTRPIAPWPRVRTCAGWLSSDGVVNLSHGRAVEEASKPRVCSLTTGS
jgi:Zn-dependent alcohol dehydrogenase